MANMMGREREGDVWRSYSGGRPAYSPMGGMEMFLRDLLYNPSALMQSYRGLQGFMPRWLQDMRTYWPEAIKQQALKREQIRQAMGGDEY